MDPVVGEVIAAVERGDWPRVKGLLHPYLHWSEPGVALRGRTRVLALLAERPAPAAPASHELRDGQIYRWTG